MNSIAITIQNFVQFYSIEKLINKLLENNIVDIYVPTYDLDLGYHNMYNEIYDHLIKSNYKVYRKSDNSIRYKIVMEPDNLDNYFEFNYEYKIKYKYFVVSSKPQLLYQPNVNIGFDAILCHSTYERDILSVFSETYLVGKLNYTDFVKKKEKSYKKTLLFLPTYGEFNSSFDIINELKKLKEKYNIIVKIHHGTNYLIEEEKTKKELSLAFDEIYDSKTKIENILSKADVVLSDNSGSIFDALYCNVPVCIFSTNIKKCSYFELDSLQYQMVQKNIIPYTDKVYEIDTIIEQCLSEEVISLQNEESKKLFPLRKEDYLKTNLDVINKFLNDNVDMNKIKMHRILSNNYKELINKNQHVQALSSLIYNKEKEIKSLNNEIENLKKNIEALKK